LSPCSCAVIMQGTARTSHWSSLQLHFAFHVPGLTDSRSICMYSIAESPITAWYRMCMCCHQAYERKKSSNQHGIANVLWACLRFHQHSTHVQFRHSLVKYARSQLMGCCDSPVIVLPANGRATRLRKERDVVG